MSTVGVYYVLSKQYVIGLCPLNYHMVLQFAGRATVWPMFTLVSM